MMAPRPRCDYPFTHFEVNNPNGDVTFCCNHTLVLGNVNRQGIAEIWNGAAYRKVRRAFLAGKLGDYCSDRCPVLQGWKDYEKLDWYRELPADDPVRRNAELNEQEIAAGKTELASRPRWLRFAGSYRCNLRCYHCFQEGDRELDLSLPDGFYGQARAELPTLQVLFLYGGEPFCEGRNLDLLDELARRGGSTRLFVATNGTMLPPRARAALEQIRIGLVAVSIDSCRGELYEKLRAPARWNDLQENLRFLARIAAARGAEFHFGMTINKQNLDELNDYGAFAQGFKATPLFQFAHNPARDGRFRREYEIYTAEEWRTCGKVLERAAQAAAANGLALTERNLRSLAAIAAAEARPGRLLRQAVRSIRGFGSRMRKTVLKGRNGAGNE